MKTNVISMLMLSCLLFCCKLPHEPDKPHDPGNKKKYPVTFMVEGFKMTIENFGKTTADTISKYISHLYMVVFPLNGAGGL